MLQQTHSVSVLDYGFVARVPGPDDDLKVCNAARGYFNQARDQQSDVGASADEPRRHKPQNPRLTDAERMVIGDLVARQVWEPFAHIRRPALVPLDIYDEISGSVINAGGFEIDFPEQHKEHALLSCTLAHVRDFPFLATVFNHDCPVSVAALLPDPPTNPVTANCFWEEAAPQFTPVTLHIKLPVFVDRWLNLPAVGFACSERGRRHGDKPPEFHNPEQWWRQSAPGDAKKEEVYVGVDTRHAARKHPKGVYESLMYAGVSPRQANIVLPMSVYTEWWVTGSLSSWAALLRRMRFNPDTPDEVRRYAQAVDGVLTSLHPEQWPATRDQ